jgi:hypothetical protein
VHLFVYSTVLCRIGHQQPLSPTSSRRYHEKSGRKDPIMPGNGFFPDNILENSGTLKGRKKRNVLQNQLLDLESCENRVISDTFNLQ